MKVTVTVIAFLLVLSAAAQKVFILNIWPQIFLYVSVFKNIYYR